MENSNGYIYEYVSTNFHLIILMRWTISLLLSLLGISKWSLKSLIPQNLNLLKYFYKQDGTLFERY